MGKIIAVTNQKGGVGKTTTTINIGCNLVKRGYKVLLVDADPQGSLTASLGWNPDAIDYTLADIMSDVVNDTFSAGKGILHHEEGCDVVPANITLSGLEVSLVSTMCREYIMKRYLDSVKDLYDIVLLDCMPSLGIITINALTAADAVLIPVQASYLSVKGLEQLMKTIAKCRKVLNPGLSICGIVITMVDSRTTFNREITQKVKEIYGQHVRIFETVIPTSIRAAEASATGSSLAVFEVKSKVAQAYRDLATEIFGRGL